MRGFQPNRGDSAVKNRGEGPRGFHPAGADGAARAQALNQAPDTIPAMVKPGEFVLPPDTVHALGGPQALQGVVDATHTPAPEAAIVPHGFEPRMFFSNAGLVQEEQQRANSFGDAAAAAASPGVAQVGATAAPAASTSSSPGNTFPGNRLQGDSGAGGAPVGAADVPKPVQPPAPAPTANASPTGLYMQDRAQELKDQWGQGQYAQAVGTAARTAVQGLGMYGVEAADKLTSPWVDAAKGFGTGLLGSDVSAPAVAAPAAAQSPAARAGADTPADQRLASGTQPAPGASAASELAAPRGPSSNVTKTVGPDGRVTYSGANVGGDITVNGEAPRNGGQVSAQNMAAAENLARGFQPGMVAAAAENPTRGSGPAGVAAPVVRHSGNDWQARKDLENAATAASSIMYRPSFESTGMGRFRHGGQPAGDAPAVAAYQAALATDQALKSAQPGTEAAAMSANANLQREGMQQAGETARTGMRVGVDQQRAITDARLADSKITARGFDIEAARQRAQLSAVLTNPNSTAQDKAQAQKGLAAMQGKDPHDRWRLHVTPTVKNQDGSTTEGGVWRINEASGQTERVDQGQGGAAAPPTAAVAALRADPQRAAEFETKYAPIYGVGIAKRILG